MSKLPVPCGYSILIKIPPVEEKFGGGVLVKAETTKQNDAILSMVGEVLSLGDGAYKDTDRFPTGPWCKEGDFVLFRTHTGTRFLIDEVEYRLINDDSVQAVVPDPHAIKRAY